MGLLKIKDLKLQDRLGTGRLATVYNWEDGKVIKVFHNHIDRSEVDFEYKIMRIMNSTQIRTPHTYDLVEEQNQFGIVMDKVTGDILVKSIHSKWWKVAYYARLMADTQKTIHQHSSDDLPDYKEILDRNVKKVSYLTTTEKELVLDHLETLPSGNAICHGDYHPENVILDGEQLQVIDWVTAKRGHPLFDIARTSMIIQFSASPRSWLSKIIIGLIRNTFHRHYLNRYFQGSKWLTEELEQFYLPIMVARLREEIDDEREILLSEIRKRLKSRGE